MTTIIGLTGGIASGKTTITNFLKKKKYVVHDSDSVVKKIYSKPSRVFLKHLKLSGLSKSIKGKKIDKKIIREEIFNNKYKKKKLEKFIHAHVRKSREIFIKKNKIKKTKVLILDIPLLFETKLEKICNYIIFLYTPKKVKIQRAIKRKGMNKEILLKILKNQLDDKYKKTKSDFVINTSNTKKVTFKMILKSINIIMSKNA